MSDTTERLRRILSEERRRGFDNRSVAGGLDAFLERVRDHPDPELRQALLILPPEGYGGLSRERRHEWASTLGVGDRGRPNGATAPPASRPPPRDTSRGGRPRTARRPAAVRVAPGAITLSTPVDVLPGVRRDVVAKLATLGVAAVRDLLYFFPHRHADYTDVRSIADLRPGDETTVVAEIWSGGETRLGRRMRATEAVVSDGTGTLRAVWFNQPWIAKQLRSGTRVVLSGRIGEHRGRLTIESPEWEPLDGDLTHTGRLVPIYPLTAGLAQRTVRKLVKSVVDAQLDLLEDPVPGEVLQRTGLLPLREAVRQMHYPDTSERFGEARRRLAFDELLTIELAMLGLRRERSAAAQAPALPLAGDVRASFEDSLPFALTAAQRRSADDILADLARPVAMSRLLQGDVGSGKTVVAALALLAAVVNGHQGSVMAPTEILAEQHFRTLRRVFHGDDTQALHVQPPYLDRPVRVERLVGGMSAAEKGRVAAAIESGEVDIAVGTHALIQEAVRFRDLRVAVVDEQHRFGVVQRASLREKSAGAHLLVMTATPIPRTLALTVYGDLDLSVIDEMPPGRTPVKTQRVAPHERQEAYDFVQSQIAMGRQAFIICPLVEESDAVQARAATQEFDRLRIEVFPELRERMGLLHGRIGSREKDATMRAFAAGELSILVSTAVVEVGIDVPNATVMMIEGADRFGLAQLHQFRGRVGRGAHRSYCLLLADSPSPEADQRLALMEETSDGFRLAEADLALRGPGEYLGTRQSGVPELRVATLTDLDIIRLARDEAEAILDADPELREPEHGGLRDMVARAWAGRDGAPTSLFS